MRKTSCLLALAGVLHVAAAWPADDPGSDRPEAESAVPESESAFYSRIYVLAYWAQQDVKNSPANPGNALGLPSREAVVNPRVDLDLTLRRWEFSIKPRAIRSWEEWKEGTRSGEHETHSDLFVNEGFVRYRPVDQLLLSVGRENLQWGPSAIMSSSNPFNRANGRNNPRLEIPGLDFVRAVWIPSPTWTLSAIANTGAGRMDTRDPFAALFPASTERSGSGSASLPRLGYSGSWAFSDALRVNGGSGSDGFERSYALKLDYTGPSSYFSLIPSWRKDTRYRLGLFGGWTASDALLVYAEGSLGQRRRKLSPSVECFLAGRLAGNLGPGGPEGSLGGSIGSGGAQGSIGGSVGPGGPAGSLAGSISLSRAESSLNNKAGERIFQVGAAYTLEAGPTITLELLYNKRGCKDDPIAVCVASGQVDARDVLLRRRYAMLQLTDTESIPDLSVSLRLLRNLDDHSQRLVGILEYDLSKHVQLYLNVDRYFGDTTTELGSLLRQSWFVGLGYTF